MPPAAATFRKAPLRAGGYASSGTRSAEGYADPAARTVCMTTPELSAEEAKDFGLVDKVFETRPEGDATGEEEGSGGAPE